MRRIVGRQLSEVDIGEVDALICAHRRAVLDLGTGDGAAVLRLARQQPDTFVIGVDTNAAALVDASRRAAHKRAESNAIFLIGDAADALGGRSEEDTAELQSH